MLRSAGFFFFTHNVEDDSGLSRRIAIIYKPPGPVQRGALDEVVLMQGKGPLLPDAVVIVALKGASQDLQNELGDDISLAARSRLAGRAPLFFASYDLRTGAIKQQLLDASFERREALYVAALKPVSTWLVSGLQAVFPATEVVLKAPPGYAYQKPSGARSDIFLKPDQGLKTSANVAFVALAIYHKLFANRVQLFKDLETVYVDTMSIASIAYELKDILKLAGYDRSFQIESFHSYGGFEQIERPLPRTSLCLISASSSMSLHRKWIVDKGVGRDEVLTLLTFECEGENVEDALLSLPAPPGSTAEAKLSIRIQGEHFQPEQEPAKKVLLTDRFHRCDDEVKWFSAFAGLGVFDVYRRPPISHSKVRSLYVDGEALLSQPKFIDWLEKAASFATKAATKAILYQNDPASKTMAWMLQEIYGSHLALAPFDIAAANDLATLNLPSDCAVVVCAAVIGKGSQLLETSRALRDSQVGARLYLIGYQVTECRSELTSLKNHLAHCKGPTQHEVLRFGSAAVGTQILESFQSEASLYYSSASEGNSAPSALRARARSLGTTSPAGRTLLLPRLTVGDDTALRLRPGFAYWPEGYQSAPYQPEVLATMAVILQRAREDEKNISEERRLSSPSYRHVLLDPENFARFNDGVVQAALLRSAHPSELDYRSDSAASDFMKALILRALERHQEESGEGLPEFLAAIALERLQLMPEHVEAIKKAVGSSARLTKDARDICKFLLRTEHPQPTSLGDLPF